MTPVVFWDEDTQHDFMDPDGKLYVPGAERIIPNLDRLTRCARQHGVPIIALMCDHTESDAEISAQPDFRSTFPPHCIRGTRGQERIDATTPQHPAYIENRPYTHTELEALWRTHRGEIVIKKQALDPFSNPGTALLLDVIDPRTVVVYGVAQDFCVHHAIMGLVDRRRRVWYVRDASQPISAEGAQRCEAEWRRRGIEFVSTADVVEAVESGKLKA
jgi:nicotinamidase/pyrazinamidase